MALMINVKEKELFQIFERNKRENESWEDCKRRISNEIKKQLLEGKFK